MWNNIILIVTHWPTIQNTVDLVKVCSPYGRVIVLADEAQCIDCEVKIYRNEGYDFWKIYRFLQEPPHLRIMDIDMLCITNDTISPIWDFKSLFDKSKDYEFFGATDWYTWHPTMEEINGYHIQSFFHIFRWKAINHLREYYVKHWVKKDKESGVLTYEMGLSKMMIKNKMKIGVLVSIDEMMKKYNWKRYEPMIFARFLAEVYDPKWELNATFMYPIQYIEAGLPFVKNSMFQYHFRPLRFLYHITKRALEINKDKVLQYIINLFNSLDLWKQAKGFIIYMCSIIFNNK